MRWKFSLPVGPISINSTFYGDKRHGMRPEAKEWYSSVFFALSEPTIAEKLRLARNSFDLNKHGYAIRLLWFIPKTVLYTKAGDLSSRSIDLTNCEKSIVDALFLPKHFGTNVPYQCENLNVDDRYLRRLFSEKKASLDGNYRLDITIKLISK